MVLVGCRIIAWALVSLHDLLLAVLTNKPFGYPIQVVMCYSGRKNVETFLKEAIFLGGDEYVATGCDSGNIVVWHRRSGTMVNKLR